jgi:hypothetical protein
MNNITVKNILLDVLIDIQLREDAGTLDKGCGICGAVTAYTNQMVEEDRMTRAEQRRVLEQMRDLFPRWPSFSGNTCYPVPSCASGAKPGEMYHHRSDRYALWDRETVYGQMRWQLVDWMAMTLRKDIAALEQAAVRKAMHAALVMVKASESVTEANPMGRTPLNRAVGLCTNVANHTFGGNSYMACKQLMQELFAQWPLYSGCSRTPVPGSNGENASDAYAYTNDKWDRDTEYGRNRWELVDWMIAQLESESDSEVVS